MLEHHLEQPPQDNRVADVTDEQLVEAEHADVFAQFPGERLQRIGGPVELEQPFVHPAHEVMEVQTTRRDPQAAVKHIHQPGLAAPHRAPQIDATRRHFRTFVMQRFMTALQPFDGDRLSRIADEALVGDSLSIQGKWGRWFHAG